METISIRKRRQSFNLASGAEEIVILTPVFERGLEDSLI